MNTELCVQDNIAEDIVESSNQALPINEDINEVVNLCEGHVFLSWEEVDKFVKAYSKQQGFGVARKRDTRDHRNRKSKRQKCGWHVNINCPKNVLHIILTTQDDVHNHPLCPDAQHYASIYWNISEDVLNEIQFLTEHGNLTIGTQRKLLKAKFSTEFILDCNLSNTIQKFKIHSNKNLDASHLLTILIEQKSHDHGWAVEFELDDENRLVRLFWISPAQIVFWLEYHDVILNDNTAKTNRYQMPLSLFLTVDNNTRSCLVVQALVSDKTTESYNWILGYIKKATITEPLVFVTDANPAVDAAIK
ncbi:hypothetical protein Glove_319g96 [Diversispora epigaea]|uniref:MULE transposase domain-containing protein n=1 Tax=Diversispora epigaea TaxID=1348612 RepID=A0A397HPL3_9GLOM|nr:hypothetical protein Glove_319g96 [Diversispora epigaea]